MQKVQDSTNEEKSKPVTTNKILTQRLKSYTPDCNLKCALFTEIFLIIVFIAFGVPIIVQSGQINEREFFYTSWYQL